MYLQLFQEFLHQIPRHQLFRIGISVRPQYLVEVGTSKSIEGVSLSQWHGILSLKCVRDNDIYH